MASLVWFFSLTFVVTWTCFIAAGAWIGNAFGGDSAPIFRGLLLFVGIFAPAMVALCLTAQSEGRAGVLTLLGRLFEWRVGARWYLFAVGYMAAIKLASALLYRTMAGAWPRFGTEEWYIMLGGTLLSTITLGQAGEEIGWRGYALPKLSAHLGIAPASILLGIIWAVWHLPLFYMRGTDTFGQSFPLYLLQVTALSVAIAWLYAHTHGSLLLAMLMHAAINNTKDIVPAVGQAGTNPFALNISLLSWLTAGLLWSCALYFAARMTPSRGSPSHLGLASSAKRS